MATKKIVIWGLGTIAASIIDSLPGMEVLGIVNDELEGIPDQGRFKKVPVIGGYQDIPKLLEDTDTYLTVTYRDMKNEEQNYKDLVALGLSDEKFINIFHQSVIIPEEYCSLGKGIFMAPNVQLSTNVRINDYCVLYGNCFIGHDATLEDFVSVANMSSIGAHVKIGKGVHVGSNSTIRERVTIGEFSLVGMGSVVLHDVPPHSIVAGVPARVIGQK